MQYRTILIYSTICHYVWVVDWMKEIADVSMQATESTVDVTPPQAATKIMAGMADRMVVWQTEWSNGGNGGNGRTAERMAEWQNGRSGYIRTIYGTRRQQRQRHHLNLL
jgi:hypothetical protein